MTKNNKSIIAIVDDDEPLREALGSVMKAAGFLIDTFPSAEDFFVSPQRKNTACLILDVRLPGMSGIELQRRMLEAHCRIPIIFISAHGDSTLRDIVMRAGAIDFLSKPVRSETLLRAIRTALGETDLSVSR